MKYISYKYNYFMSISIVIKKYIYISKIIYFFYYIWYTLISKNIYNNIKHLNENDTKANINQYEIFLIKKKIKKIS